MTDGICEGTTLGIEGTMLGIHEGIELGEIDLMTLGFIEGTSDVGFCTSGMIETRGAYDVLTVDENVG